ncbi:hypothetical protein [Sulfuriferula nivalis]|uniref:Uncharacterized protein n=1 Tax=Sulfuriferula nivalis TaxID=2675298 RepID=A0A809SHL6_9PROT|nr:hypothetical protein [Sulfuriferula nivalis]BBP00910.1 hypothetical protein SFSGTM_16180 [Sulfuriferula nivalis]
MIIQPSLPISTITNKFSPLQQKELTRSSTSSTDTITISQEARNALSSALSASSNSGITADPELAKLDAKVSTNGNTSNLTADELDYYQKAHGFVNTMASLIPSERALYDKMVASGNVAAAAGMGDIAFTRTTLGHMASTQDGATYDPTNMAITPNNIIKYFSQSSNDPTGNTQSQFQALIQYLQNNPTIS